LVRRLLVFYTGKPIKGVPKIVYFALWNCNHETWNLKAKVGTRDIRFIQARTARVVDPTSCLGYYV
jgi:hypothetical protein